MGCDFETVGNYCVVDGVNTGQVCVTPGDPCTVDGNLGVCTQFITNLPGSTVYDSLLQTYHFVRNGSGTVALAFGVSVVGCPLALPGTGTEDIVAGDYIKATIFFDVRVADACLGGTFQPEVEPDVTNFDGDAVGGYQWAYTMQADATTGFDSSLTYSALFSDPGWDKKVSSATLSFRAQVRGFHGDNSPANFSIKHPGGGYAVELSASVSGTCCDHTVTYSDIDP